MVESASGQTESERQIEILVEMAAETAEDPIPELFTDAFVVADAGGVISYANPAARSLFRRLHAKGNIVGTHIRNICIDPSIERAILVDKTCVNREVRAQNLVLLVKAVPLYRSGKLFGYGMVIRDITETREQEKELAAKSAIIQEIHHRVKNNLQTIASLLRLQQRRIDSAAGKDVLADSIDRIMAVAAVHEILSKEGPDLIDVTEVARKIVEMQQVAQREPGSRITAGVTGDRIMLTSKKAMSVGLVINELTQNAFSHAFCRRAEGKIEVALEDRGRSVILRVSDDGTGFPEGLFLREPMTLGLSIVRALVVDNLEGVIEISNRNGASIEIQFPKTAEREGGASLWRE